MPPPSIDKRIQSQSKDDYGSSPEELDPELLLLPPGTKLTIVTGAYNKELSSSFVIGLIEKFSIFFSKTFRVMKV